MLYAKDYKSAKMYIGKNYDKHFFVKRTTVNCACGETDGFYIYDDHMKIIDKIAICESCYHSHDNII